MDGIPDNIISLAKEHVFIVAAVAIFLLFLLFRKPKFFLAMLLLLSLLFAIWYFISDISSTEKAKKEQMLEKGLHPGMADRL